MKKTLLLIASLLLVLSHAFAEGFDGTVYEAYRPIFDEAFLSGWEVISYIEPSGLLLSANTDDADITITIQDSDMEPDSYLVSHVAGVTRYGKDIRGGTVSPLKLDGYTSAAQVSYSYRSLRDSGEGDVNYVEMVAARLKKGYVLTVSRISWGGAAAGDDFLERFVKSLKLEQIRISTTYYALLTYCEEKSDGIYLTLDYCEVEYNPVFGVTYITDTDDTEHVYKLRSDAQLWLPDIDGALYSIHRVGADATEISIAIENHFNLYESHAVYLVLFDERGDIIRMQHYNAL